MSTLYLFGAGNPEGVRLAMIVNRLEKNWKQIVILDDNPEIQGKTILDIEVIGGSEQLSRADSTVDSVINLVAKSTVIRQSARDKVQVYGLPFARLIHPNVDIFGVRFSEEITVYQNVSFCADAFVGEGSVCLTGSVIGHGSRIGRNCIIAPGAVINARAELGDGVYVGTNSSILPDLKIGAWSTIGSNSAVLQNVPPGATVMGVPAQVLVQGREPLYEQSNRLVLDNPESSLNLNVNRESKGLKSLRSAQKEFFHSNRDKPE